MMIGRALLALSLSALCLLADVATAAPAASKETLARAARHIKYAERHLEKKEYDQAIEEYLQVKSWVPEPRIEYLLGNAYRLKGDEAKAKECFGRYLKAEPNGAYAAEARAFVAGEAAPGKGVKAEGSPEPSAAAAAVAVVSEKAVGTAGPAGSAALGAADATVKEGATPAPVQSPAKVTASTVPIVREKAASPQPSEPAARVPAEALPAPPEPAVLTHPAPATQVTAVAVKRTPVVRKPIYRRWWLWTIVGSVAARGAVGAALGLTLPQRFETTLPDVGSQGAVRF